MSLLHKPRRFTGRRPTGDHRPDTVLHLDRLTSSIDVAKCLGVAAAVLPQRPPGVGASLNLNSGVAADPVEQQGASGPLNGHQHQDVATTATAGCSVSQDTFGPFARESAAGLCSPTSVLLVDPLRRRPKHNETLLKVSYCFRLTLLKVSYCFRLTLLKVSY
ncbi:MAG: hypothetical protein ACPGNP_09220, partial [Acidimicrobiales bacterium]